MYYSNKQQTKLFLIANYVVENSFRDDINVPGAVLDRSGR